MPCAIVFLVAYMFMSMMGVDGEASPCSPKLLVTPADRRFMVNCFMESNCWPESFKSLATSSSACASKHQMVSLSDESVVWSPT